MGISVEEAIHELRNREEVFVAYSQATKLPYVTCDEETFNDQARIFATEEEIKEYGTVKMLLPEAGTLERAVTYRDKKIKPLFLQIKNKVAVMAAQVKELTKEVEGWKRKYQKVKQKYNAIQRELDDIRKDNQKLSEEKDILQGVSDRYDRVVRVLGIETVDTAVQQDIQNEKVLEEKRRMEQMPKGNIHERLAWGMKKSEMENQQRKKTKSKNREMER